MFKKLFTILFLFTGVNLIAQHNETDQSLQYIEAQYIVLNQDGIFVMIDGECFPVRTISYAGNGYYYMDKGSWECPRCHTINEWWRLKCKNCRLG